MPSTYVDTLLAAPLTTQVAQRMIVGLGNFEPHVTHAGRQPSAETQQLLALGLGGLICFHQDMAGFTDPVALADWVNHVKNSANENTLPLWVGVDEEGGLIERLPSSCFPSFPHFSGLAQAVQQQQQPDKDFNGLLAAECFDLQAFYLNLLGFNLNFSPTLDMNTQPENPVIEVRSFGDNAELIQNLAAIVAERHGERGVIPVGKHAPGHGSATVDSHHQLSTLHPTDNELAIFQWAASQEHFPVLMLAHAVYPALSNDTHPASLSPDVVSFIRNHWQFDGVLVTDDLCMGAIELPPVDAALQACRAGIDVLLYRECTETQLAIHQAIVAGLESGDLSMDAHYESLARIAKAKERYLSADIPQPQTKKLQALLSPTAIEATSRHYAQATLVCHTELSEQTQPFITPEHCTWVIEPDWASHPHYGNQPNPIISEALKAAHCPPVHVTHYSASESTGILSPPSEIDTVVWIRLFPQDQEFFQAIKNQLPENATVIVVDVGIPTEQHAGAIHVSLGSGRPAYRQGLVDWLTGQ